MTMPPQILGLNDQARACRLALAIFDDDRGRYDAAMADALGHGPELIYALTRNWVGSIVGRYGCEGARVRVEGELLSIAEFQDELGSR